MTSGKFESSSIDWEIGKVLQNVGEWFELTFFNNPSLANKMPDLSLPTWLMQTLFWGMVAALTLWTGVQLFRLLRPYLARSLFSERDAYTDLSQPPEAMLAAREWLERSRQAQQQGNYREACRALYYAALQHLNDKDLIRHQLSRTDGEYLDLIHPLAQASPYEVLIQTHEQLCFSHDPISIEQWERCRQAYQEIEKA